MGVRGEISRSEFRRHDGVRNPFQIGEKSALPVPKTNSKPQQDGCDQFLIDEGVVRVAQVREEFELIGRVANHAAEI